MNISKFSLVVLSCAALLAGEASAKGCLAGAAVGGVAGHVAGKYAVIGAGVGCVVGRHQANKKDRAAAASQATATPTAGASVPSK
jgi:hypothetical protein